MLFSKMKAQFAPDLDQSEVIANLASHGFAVDLDKDHILIFNPYDLSFDRVMGMGDCDLIFTTTKD